LKNKAEFDRLVAEIWGGLDGKKNTSKKLGAGTVYSGRKPAQARFALDVPRDVSWSPAGAAVDFLHRSAPEGEIYFISSQSAEPANLELEFRQTDRAPELWDAATGLRADAEVFRKTKTGIALPVAFEPWGAVFVIFRKPLPARWTTAVEPASVAESQTAAGLLSKTSASSAHYSDGAGVDYDQPQPPPATQTIAAPWRVTFPDGRGAPSGELVFDQLISWPNHPDDGVKYYSGTAIYRATFNVTAAPQPRQAAFLDLGEVADIARVYVNGRDAGILWKPPFRADITALLKRGENTLEIHVANRWINRLIGDEAVDDGLSYQPAGTNKFTDGRILKLPGWLYDPAKRAGSKRHSFSVWKHYDADSPLVPAGLLGPVTLEWLNRVAPGATP
ncbi:MAG: hypothetical protein LBM92_05980, partial [Opitutaceae bacterium]|jgi:hypothetical protein|nr:hypothetical protein [Opitutaceae bacterium]